MTGKPVARVYVHPGRLYGDAAFAPGQIAAIPTMIAGLRREGAGFAGEMYRLLGDRMRGTELHVRDHAITAAEEMVGTRGFGPHALAGHGASNLAVLDQRTRTLIARDPTFYDPAPSTPHADLTPRRASLTLLEEPGLRPLVPGHGPYDPTPATAIDQILDWLDWLEAALWPASTRADARLNAPRFRG